MMNEDKPLCTGCKCWILWTALTSSWQANASYVYENHKNPSDTVQEVLILHKENRLF